MSAGLFHEKVERGLCPECAEWRCQCDQEVEPVAVYCGRLLGGEWREVATGRIVSAKRAEELNSEQQNNNGGDEPPERWEE
jgi:hypothetical protein